MAGKILMGAVLDQMESPKPVALNEWISGGNTFAAWVDLFTILFGVAGWILVLVVSISKRNREMWFFWWTIAIASAWCLLAPLGLMIGLTLLAQFIVTRKEFARPY